GDVRRRRRRARVGGRTLARWPLGACLAALQGELDRGRYQRGSAQHRGEKNPWLAGRVKNMSLILNTEQEMLRDNARGFLSKNAPVAHLRQLRDSKDAIGFSRALWAQFAELGWAGILIPQEHGGLALGHVEMGVVMEELGRTLTPSPLLSTAIVAATAIS